MLKNYIVTAFRNFWRNKAFSLINVLGLSIGISAALVIFLIVYYELSYDKFEPDRDRIYHVVLDAKFNGVDGHSSAVHAPLASAIQNEVTGVQLTVPVIQFPGDGKAQVNITKANTSKPVVFKHQPDIVFTNPQYFSLVPYRWLAGSPVTALQNPFMVVLSESRAHQYFPSLSLADVIGKQISYDNDFGGALSDIYKNKITLTVSGIVKNLDEHTTFTGAEFLSYATLMQTHLRQDIMMDSWTDWMSNSQLYIKLSKGSNSSKIEARLKGLLAKYNKDANKDAANTMSFHLQPFKDVHFDGNYRMVDQRIADLSVLYGLLAVAGFLLLLGCINFINLTTANAAGRAKEIGIRKTMGSSRKQLVFQFLGETFFITFIATALSVLITPLLLHIFSDFIPPGVSFNLFAQPSIFLFLFLLTVVVSLISGFYPALILSGYKPVLVLKNQFPSGSSETRHAWVRKSLTVSQFVIAQFFVIATLIVSQQINYSLNADLGFNRDGIITFNAPSDTSSARAERLLSAIHAIPQVQTASIGFMPPASTGASFANISYPAKPNINSPVQIRWGDSNYLKVYNIKLLAGRNVKPTDSLQELVINQTYATLMGFKTPGEALGKFLLNNNESLPIVGVMQDFHDQSMRGIILPLVFKGGSGNTFHIKLKPNTAETHSWQQGISQIQKTYKQLYPDADFDYEFYDETIAGMYKSEQHTASLLSWATGLAIFISCLGLLGLVMYTINTRGKEIGIRKILGASVASIVSVLSIDFVKLVCVAFLIAAPLAWWAMYNWLQNYAYRTGMSLWLFIAAGAFMLFAALLTLSIQIIKAATANPIKSLRTE